MNVFRSLIQVLAISALVLTCTPHLGRGQQTTAPQRPTISASGIQFVFIPPGQFLMGSPADERYRGKDEGQRRIILTQGFYMQTTEVTRRQWREVMGRNTLPSASGGPDLPITNVSWKEVQRFIYLLNKREQTDRYRLPTEAEWEYACRAGTSSAFSNGLSFSAQCGYDTILDPIGWFAGNSAGRPQAVALKQPNPWGLYDMHGNVWEWCQDSYSRRYVAKSTGAIPTVTDPKGPTTGYGRVFRGGGFNFPAYCSRSANRKWVAEGFEGNNLGFRLVFAP